VLEPALIVLRLVQFAGAMVLFGCPLLLVYALPREGVGSGAQLGWARPLLGWAGVFLAAATLAGLLVQTANLAGSLGEAIRPDALQAVITTMSIGASSLVRAAAAGLAVVLALVLRPGRGLFLACTALGAVACGSFAWMGHGAGGEEPGRALHVAADVVHGLAAGAWIGALVAFFGLLGRRTDEIAMDGALYKALHGFAGVGTVLVAVLAVTGLVNSWFLVGPAHIDGLWTTPYGRLLSLKLLVVAGMLGLAASNRFRLTPALGLALDEGRPRAAALTSLRRSVALETALSLAVLALVAWFGTLPPPASR
jgi:copper resistance protein D